MADQLLYEDTDKKIYLVDPGEYSEDGEEISPRVERIEWVNENCVEARLEKMEQKVKSQEELLVEKKVVTQKEVDDKFELIKTPIERVNSKEVIVDGSGKLGLRS